MPYKWELGGVSHESCVAVIGIASYLDDLIGKGKGGKVTRADAERAFEVMAAAEQPLQVLCTCHCTVWSYKGACGISVSTRDIQAGRCQLLDTELQHVACTYDTVEHAEDTSE